MSFYSAAREGDIEQLKRFLEAGANVNQRFNGDRTALHFACDSGNVEAVKLLLEFRADPDIPDNFNRGTPLHLASEAGHLEIARLLLTANANFNVQDAMNKETPLHLACDSNSSQIVSLLLEMKADPSIRNLYNKEPLSYAKTQVVKDLFLNRASTEVGPEETIPGVHSRTALASNQPNRPWYGGSTIVGRSFNGAEKENQDAFFLIPRVGGDSGVFLFGVTDGHGRFGRHVSQLVKQNIYRFIDVTSLRQNKDDTAAILEQACTSLQQMLEKQGDFDAGNSGCTLVMALLIDDVLFVCNTGDSRCVMASEMQGGRLKAIPLSDDHIPSDAPERERIEAAGGVVRRSEDPVEGEYGRHRVWRKDMTGPGLAMSRSLGDLQAHQVGVSHLPDVKRHDLGPEDKLLLIASDGVWDMFSNEEAVDIVARTCGADGQADANLACQQLCAAAKRTWEIRESRIDDITAVMILLPQRRKAASLQPTTPQNLGAPSPVPPGAMVEVQDRVVKTVTVEDNGGPNRSVPPEARYPSLQTPPTPPRFNQSSVSPPRDVSRTPSHILYSVEAEPRPAEPTYNDNYIPAYSSQQPKISEEDPWTKLRDDALRTIGMVPDKAEGQRVGANQRNEEECVIQ